MYQLQKQEADIRKQAATDGITHLSTGIAVIYDNKILIVRREPGDYLGGYFELPGGGIDGGETFAEAVKREAFEEVGLRVSKVLKIFPGFDYTTPSKPKVRQINFLVEATDHNVKLSAEHDAWKWIDLASLPTLPLTDVIRECIKAAFVKAALEPINSKISS